MDQGNWFLTEELSRQRREDIGREIAHEQFMREHGLDLWSVLRRSFAARLLRRKARSIETASAPRPLRAGHRAFAGRPDLVEPQPAGAGGDMRDTAA